MKQTPIRFVALAFIAGASAGANAAVATDGTATAATSVGVAKAPGADTQAAQPMSHDMSYRQMVDIMQMDDTSRFAKVMLDQLEWRNGGADEGRAAWDAQGYYGGDYDKLWIKSEGKYVSDGRTGVHDADVEVLWDRVISTLVEPSSGRPSGLWLRAITHLGSLGRPRSCTAMVSDRSLRVPQRRGSHCRSAQGAI